MKGVLNVGEMRRRLAWIDKFIVSRGWLYLQFCRERISLVVTRVPAEGDRGLTFVFDFVGTADGDYADETERFFRIPGNFFDPDTLFGGWPDKLNFRISDDVLSVFDESGAGILSPMERNPKNIVRGYSVKYPKREETFFDASGFSFALRAISIALPQNWGKLSLSHTPDTLGFGFSREGAVETVYGASAECCVAVGNPRPDVVHFTTILPHYRETLQRLAGKQKILKHLLEFHDHGFRISFLGPDVRVFASPRPKNPMEYCFDGFGQPYWNPFPLLAVADQGEPTETTTAGEIACPQSPKFGEKLAAALKNGRVKSSTKVETRIVAAGERKIKTHVVRGEPRITIILPVE